jgi:hypothetical protein
VTADDVASIVTALDDPHPCAARSASYVIGVLMPSLPPEVCDAISRYLGWPS